MLKTEDFTLIFQHLPIGPGMNVNAFTHFLSDPYYCINLMKYSPTFAKLQEFYFVTKPQSTEGLEYMDFAGSNMTVNIF